MKLAGVDGAQRREHRKTLGAHACMGRPGSEKKTAHSSHVTPGGVTVCNSIVLIHPAHGTAKNREEGRALRLRLTGLLWLLQAEVAMARALAVKDEKEARARARALRRSEYGSNTAMQWCDPPKSTRHSHVSFQLR